MACIAKNRDLSYCKVVEVIAQTTAPLTPMEELLKKIPSQRPIIFSQKVSLLFSLMIRLKISELSHQVYIQTFVFFPLLVNLYCYNLLA